MNCVSIFDRKFYFFNQFCFDFWSFMIRFENLQFSELLVFVKFVFFSFHHLSHSYWTIVKWNEDFAAHVKRIRFFIRQRFCLKKWKQQSILSLFYLRCESEKRNLKCAKWNEIFSFFFFKDFFWRNLFYNF